MCWLVYKLMEASRLCLCCRSLSGFMAIRLLLQVHSRNKGFKSEKEKQELLKELASITFDYSGAELQNVL
jgi:hypothetical protein